LWSENQCYSNHSENIWLAKHLILKTTYQAMFPLKIARWHSFEVRKSIFFKSQQKYLAGQAFDPQNHLSSNVSSENRQVALFCSQKINIIQITAKISGRPSI